MLDVLENLGTAIQDFIVSAGYPGVIFVMFMEYVFPPIPSELVLPFAGFQVAEGKFDLLTIWVASTIGSIAGSLLLYFLGMLIGDPLVRQFLRRYGRWVLLSEADYDRTLAAFNRYGEVIVFTGRLVPVVRSLVSIPAGANRMPLVKFLAYTAIGSAVWNGVLIVAGWQLGENWGQIVNLVDHYQKVVIVAVVLLVAWWGTKRVLARLNASGAAEGSLAQD